MIYTDEENKAWWASLTHTDKTVYLSRMVKEAGSIEYKGFANSLKSQFEERGTLSPKQIAAVRKWARK